MHPIKDLWVTGPTQQSTGILCTPFHTQRCDRASPEGSAALETLIETQRQWHELTPQDKNKVLQPALVLLSSVLSPLAPGQLHYPHATPPVALRMDLPLCCAKLWAGVWRCPALHLRLAKPPLKDRVHSWHCVLHATLSRITCITPADRYSYMLHHLCRQWRCVLKRPSQPRHPASETFPEREKGLSQKFRLCP